MILLDTHALIWMVEGKMDIGPLSRDLANEALTNGALFVSAISFWEIALLHQKYRMEMFDISIMIWRRTRLDSGIQEVPVTGDIGTAAAELQEFHADPADRFIAATAVLNGLTLITADARILDWPGQLLRHDTRF